MRSAGVIITRILGFIGVLHLPRKGVLTVFMYMRKSEKSPVRSLNHSAAPFANGRRT